MVESASPSETTLVAVLFPPEALPVIDIFRALGDFEDNYDIGALDALETRLCGLMNRDLAKGIVSDALLLAFGLRRERRGPLDYRPVRSRRGTLDEYRLMALMGATYRHDFTWPPQRRRPSRSSTPSLWCPWRSISPGAWKPPA